MTFLSTHKNKGKTMTKKERKPKKKKNNSDYESRHRKWDNSPTKLAARRVVAANCQLQPHMELSWKEGRKERRIWEKRSGKVGEEDGAREEKRRREEHKSQGRRRRPTAATDGRTTVADFVGWLGFQVF